jgi:FkbM family methyltransferase
MRHGRRKDRSRRAAGDQAESHGRSPEWTRIVEGPLKGAELLLYDATTVFKEMETGRYERWLFDAVEQACPDLNGRTVWDVGAWIGYHTLAFAALVGSAGRVVAFEPSTVNAERIRAHIEQNPELGKRVTLFELALGDADGEHVFLAGQHIDDGTSSGSHLADGYPPEASDVYSEFERHVVHTVRADTLIAHGDVPIPDVVKLDVEGAEHQVLDGARRLVETHRPILLVELHHPASTQRVVEQLESAGYELRVVEERLDTPQAFLVAVPTAKMNSHASTPPRHRARLTLPTQARASTSQPRILFVAMANSPHAARWISQLEGRGWKLFLFPADDPRHVPPTPLLSELAPSLRLVEGWPVPGGRGRGLAVKLTRRWKPGWPVRPWQLARMVRKFEPDIVHSLEIQHAGYLAHRARLILGDSFPTWIVSNWGSDTYIFGRVDQHRARVAEVLKLCDYYTAECERDISAARELGLLGSALPVLPAAGGVDVRAVQRYRFAGPVSRRRVIALRGYQGWAGRALVGLRAIERAADVLGDYKIVVYNWSSSPDMPLAVELAAKRTGLDFQLLPYGPHTQIWSLHGRSRALIALAIGDGISTSMLEAITMGSFPIQSCTSCANEWLEHGRTGFLVHPEDPEEVEAALRRVVEDDELVDAAARANDEVVRTRLDASVVRPQTLAMYKHVLAEIQAVATAR